MNFCNKQKPSISENLPQSFPKGTQQQKKQLKYTFNRLQKSAIEY